VQGALQPDAARTGDALGADIAALETALATLRKRYEYHQLQARKTAIETEAAPSSTAEDSDQTPPTVEEVQALQARLEQLEEELADVDLSWGVWVEPFWQAVRFGGVGIIIGWILRAIAHGN
jgi:small-conductance mechanosensitive channel